MNYKRYLFLILLIITTFFVHLSALPSDIMEERNLVTAREMADDGHWMIPTMNGELRLEKPPLPTWVGSGGMRRSRQYRGPAGYGRRDGHHRYRFLLSDHQGCFRRQHTHRPAGHRRADDNVPNGAHGSHGHVGYLLPCLHACGHLLSRTWTASTRLPAMAVVSMGRSVSGTLVSEQRPGIVLCDAAAGDHCCVWPTLAVGKRQMASNIHHDRHCTRHQRLVVCVVAHHAPRGSRYSLPQRVGSLEPSQCAAMVLLLALLSRNGHLGTADGGQPLHRLLETQHQNPSRVFVLFLSPLFIFTCKITCYPSRNDIENGWNGKNHS